MMQALRRVRRKWLWFFVLPVGLLLLGLLVAAAALTQRPAWYRPYTLDQTRLEADKRNLANLLDKISVALNNGQSIRIELDEAQLNRWIAARDEWPEALADLDLGPLEYPQILLLDGNQIRLAARAMQSGYEVVVSVSFGFHARGDEFELRWTGTRVGHCPIPHVLIGSLADPGSREEAVRVIRDGRLLRENAWVWPNGRPRFRIRELLIRDRNLRITLDPLRSE